MITLSPKAVRLVDAAVRRLDDAGVRAAWEAYAPQAGRELPPAAADLVLHALEVAERVLRSTLEKTPDKDRASDLSNDLGFICAIESELKREAGRRAI